MLQGDEDAHAAGGGVDGAYGRHEKHDRYGRLSEIIYDNAFTTHPYKHPTIGSMADLEAATVEDVREFHNTFYVPENAVLTVVGDFDMAQATQLVHQYFARVPKAARPVPRDIPDSRLGPRHLGRESGRSSNKV